MAGIIEGFRATFLGNIPFPTYPLMLSLVVSSILFFGGLLYFKRMERYFADIV